MSPVYHGHTPALTIAWMLWLSRRGSYCCDTVLRGQGWGCQGCALSASQSQGDPVGGAHREQATLRDRMWSQVEADPRGGRIPEVAR